MLTSTVITQHKNVSESCFFERMHEAQKEIALFKYYQVQNELVSSLFGKADHFKTNFIPSSVQLIFFLKVFFLTRTNNTKKSSKKYIIRKICKVLDINLSVHILLSFQCIRFYLRFWQSISTSILNLSRSKQF